MRLLINGDVLESLRELGSGGRRPFDNVIMDPPDNLGLKYAGGDDSLESTAYRDWLRKVIRTAWSVTRGHLWISFYHKHTPVVYQALEEIGRIEPRLDWHQYIWRFTFGQYQEGDCPNGYRPLLRVSRPTADLRTDGIGVLSARTLMGDKRAASALRVPDDVWDFPRVTQGHSQRRSWHPTQHPEGLYARVLSLGGCRMPRSGKADKVDQALRALEVKQALDVGIALDQSLNNWDTADAFNVRGAITARFSATGAVPSGQQRQRTLLDCFAGTGTLFRACREFGDNVIAVGIERSADYCRHIAAENEGVVVI